MAQFSMAVCNARLKAVAQLIGPSPKLKMFVGEMPLRCEEPDAQGLVVTFDLPDRWIDEPAGARMYMLQKEWTGRANTNGLPEKRGMARSFRLYTAAGQCHMQGSVSSSDIDADLLVAGDILNGQTIHVSDFCIPDNRWRPK